MTCKQVLLLALLAVTPVAVLCDYYASTTPIFAGDYLENNVKPCVIDKVCTQGLVFNEDAAADILHSIATFQTPPECKCEVDNPNCAHNCYYAQTVYCYMAFAGWVKFGGLAITAQESKLKYMTEFLEPILKPCVMQGQCGTYTNLASLNLERMKKELSIYESLFVLPDDSNCQQLLTETNVRACFYQVILKMNNYGSADAVFTLLHAPLIKTGY